MDGQSAPLGGEGLLGMLLILAKFRKMVVTITAAGTMIVLAVVFLMPRIYTATALLLPPQQGAPSSMAMAALGQSGALASLIAPSLGIKKSGDLYVGILKSRSVADSLVRRFDLQHYYNAGTLVETRKELEEASRFSNTKEGLVSIVVEDEDPKRAADMSNAYVAELERIMRRVAITEAAQRRLFFEKQVGQAQEELTKAEAMLRQTQEQTGLIQLEGQAQTIISVMARIKAQIVAKEAELSAVQTFATAHNPDLVRIRSELDSLRAQLGRMERNNKTVAGDVFIPAGKIPEGGLEYLRRLRDVRYQETLYELLAKQYELARIDEAKDTVLVQVVDSAVAPDKKTRPRYLLSAVVALLASLLLAVFAAAAREAFERAQGDPDRARSFMRLREYLRR